MAMRKRIAIVGAGNIGGMLALLACGEQLGDVVLFDVPAREKFAKGKALDLEQDCALRGFDTNVIGTSNWDECCGADVVIITAGIPRKPGQTREDLIVSNLPIIRDVADNAKRCCANSFVIVISNPLDAMVYEFRHRTGFAKEQVVGMAGVLDSARMQLLLARAANVSVKGVRALVLGGHGDDMVPILSATSISGIPATELVSRETLDAIIARTRQGGGEIVSLMGTSAYYTPASAAITMAAAYLRDEKRVLPCAAYLTGEYGFHDMYMGVPVVIGGSGVERVLEIPLTPEERAMLDRSAASVRTVIDIVRRTG